jgi:hypothetical protein
MRKNIFLRSSVGALALIMLGVACKKNNGTPADPSTVALYHCNSNPSIPSAPYICFDSLITNSLCPEDVVCVWSGCAIIKTTFHENGNAHSFKMIIPALKNFGAVNDTTINGYRIVFKDLKPNPNTTKPSPLPGEIKAAIEISR